jgi:hypothetical protein
MANSPLVFKNSAKGYVYDGDTQTLTQITDVDYPSNMAEGAQQNVTSITRTDQIATVIMPAAHGYQNGRSVTISAADQAEYNGTVVITYISTTSFSYTVTGSPATPATGTIKAQLKQMTVPGLVLLDGTYYVMTPDGTIYGSDIEAPLSWNALNYINAEVEADGGVAISKYLNYLVAFGTWTTEVFYDNANEAPGSPLRRSDNVYLPVGCADARSVAQGTVTVVWMSQAKEGPAGASAGRQITMLEAFSHKVLSTPAIERILNQATLAEVKSCIFQISGHRSYMLTLATSGVTLVYDFITQLWSSWTSCILGGAQTPTAITNSTDGLTATVHLPGHGQTDGNPVIIAGADQTEYNGTFNIMYVDADHFSYTVTGSPATPATGIITATGYVESYMPFAFHTTAGNANLFIDNANGYIYQMSEMAYDDAGAYINFLIRSPNVDFGNTDIKRLTRLDLIGDKVTGNAMVRYSKDDYQTHSAYRKIPLGTERNHLSRLGKARRATYDLRVTDSIPVRIERMDVTMESGK